MKTKAIVKCMNKISKEMHDNRNISYKDIINITSELDFDEFSFLTDFILDIRDNARATFTIFDK